MGIMKESDKRSHVKLSSYPHGGTKVEIDGVEIRRVTDITLSHKGGGVAYLTLEIWAQGGLDVELDNVVVRKTAQTFDGNTIDHDRDAMKQKKAQMGARIKARQGDHIP